MRRKISILGATGSVGANTLDMIRHNCADDWQVCALSGGTNAEQLACDAIEFKAEYVALADESKAEILKARLAGHPVEIGVGSASVLEAASCEADFVMAAISGAAGLLPTLAAIDQGCHVGLANKECLVCAGEVFMAHVRDKKTTLLPVDSEHNGIFQVLEKQHPESVRRLILTASGGPFLHKSRAELQHVTRTHALKHPTWSMGEKISIDSASLMNKGLELIEASYLFNYPSAEIDVLIHPQSIVHAMIECIDGSVLAQLGCPDMRIPIAHAMAWPQRMVTPVQTLDLTQIRNLSFFEPDVKAFPALALARQALEAGGQACTTLNAANEVAVTAFLKGHISFLQISDIVEKTLDLSEKYPDFRLPFTDIDHVLDSDRRARALSQTFITNCKL